MKTLFIVYAALILCQPANGQVSGSFLTVNEKPVVGASVQLIRSTDTIILKSGITDEKGKFSLAGIGNGKYFITASGIGVESWRSQIFELTTSLQSIDLGRQVLTENKKTLDAVVVRGSKPFISQTPYGTVLNVAGDILTKGSTVLQLLERSPGVVIDYRNGDIFLNGKSGVMIMLNGKLVRMPVSQLTSMLNGISANDISSIELLTSPPSGYDAEGNAGLINIVLKKSRRRGTTGSYSLTGGYGKGEKLTGNVGLTHNTPKSFFNGSYTFSRNHTYSDMFITSSQNMPALGGELFATLQDTTWHRQDNHNLSLGYDYKPDSTITISTSLDVNKSNTSSTNRTYGSYKTAPDSVLFFTGDIAGKNRWTNLNGSVALEKRFKPEEKLTMEADYLFYDNNNPTDVQNSFTNKNGDRAGTNDDTLFSPLQKGFAKTTIIVGVIKLDYEKQLSQKLRVEAGIKATNTRSSSLSGINSVINGNWTGRNETSNNILMKENLGAFYASVTTRFNAATTLVTGARYEYAHNSLDNLGSMAPPVVRRRGVIFPGLFFTKKITDQNELQLSYTKRISRPSYNDLASYVIYSDPAAVYTGNPYLQPTITHHIKVGWQSESFNFSLLLSRDFHPIARYQITQKPAANLLYISPQNLDWQNNITFQSNIPWRLNAWWMSNYGFTGGLRSFRVLHTLQPVEKTYFGYSANFSQAFTFPERFLLELSGWYNSFSYNGSIKVAGSFMLNLGIKKELKNERGIFQLAISDLLKTARINTYYGTIAKEAFDIKNHVSINTESQKFPIIKLTYSRSFGGGIMKAPRSNPGNNSEERERIRKD